MSNQNIILINNKNGAGYEIRTMDIIHSREPLQKGSLHFICGATKITGWVVFEFEDNPPDDFLEILENDNAPDLAIHCNIGKSNFFLTKVCLEKSIKYRYNFVAQKMLIEQQEGRTMNREEFIHRLRVIREESSCSKRGISYLIKNCYLTNYPSSVTVTADNNLMFEWEKKLYAFFNFKEKTFKCYFVDDKDNFVGDENSEEEITYVFPTLFPTNKIDFSDFNKYLSSLFPQFTNCKTGEYSFRPETAKSHIFYE